MKKYILSLIVVGFFCIPFVATAVSVSWDRFSAGNIRPLYILDTVFGNIFTATSTTQASTFPYASSTAFTTTSLCLTGDLPCRTTWPTGTITGSGSVSQLAYFTSASNLTSVATTSASCSGSTSCSAFTVIGSSPITISSTDAGGTVTQINTTFPILGGPITTTGTLTFGGLTTSTAAVIGNIPYFTGVNSFGNVATGTITCAGTASCGSGSYVIGSNLTITGAGANFGYPFTPITNWGITFDAGTTSRMYINNSGFPSFYAVNASSTALSATTFSVGGSATTSITSTGLMTGVDTNNSFVGIVSPTKRLVLSTGTTTSWTASTTNTAFSPFVTTDFTGIVRKATCLTDASFLGVNIQVNGSNISPSYFVASTTGGTILFTGNNTFTSGQKIQANFGTTTSASTLQVSCTLDVLQTS